MAILVTGGAGFIGSHTCVELLDAGKQVVVLDNFSNSKPEAVRRIEKITGRNVALVEADVLDLDKLRQVFRDHKIEAVIHFAGRKAVGESVRLPLDYYHVNVTGAVRLCQAMAEAGCKKLVFSSSATVYGPSADIPYRETHTLLPPTNPYGSTKVMIETILRDLYASDNDWSIALLRYFNPIGAHRSGLLGEDPGGIPNNLMPYICQVATGRLPFLNVFGDDYETPDGTGVRDYLHVTDLAEGHISALDYIMDRTGIEAINLGAGNGVSVLQIVKAFELASGVPIPYRIAPRRAGDIAIFYADPSKAKKLLGWQVRHSLEDMCRDSWNFIKNNPDGL